MLDADAGTENLVPQEATQPPLVLASPTTTCVPDTNTTAAALSAVSPVVAAPLVAASTVNSSAVLDATTPAAATYTSASPAAPVLAAPSTAAPPLTGGILTESTSGDTPAATANDVAAVLSLTAGASAPTVTSDASSTTIQVAGTSAANKTGSKRKRDASLIDEPVWRTSGRRSAAAAAASATSGESEVPRTRCSSRIASGGAPAKSTASGFRRAK